MNNIATNNIYSNTKISLQYIIKNPCKNIKEYGQNVVIGVRIRSASFSNALVMLPCETIFSQVLHSI